MSSTLTAKQWGQVFALERKLDPQSRRTAIEQVYAVSGAETGILWVVATRRAFLSQQRRDGKVRVIVIKWGQQEKLVISNGQYYVAAFTWRKLLEKCVLGHFKRVRNSQLAKRFILRPSDSGYVSRTKMMKVVP